MTLLPSSLGAALRLDLQRGLLAVGCAALTLALSGCETKEAPKPADPSAAPAADALPPADTPPADAAAEEDSDFQILSTDKKKKTITFRDKKTGKTETLSTEAFYKRLAEREKARAKELGDSPPKFQPGVKEATPEDLPDWVTLYAGAQVTMNIKVERDGKTAGRIAMTTSDAPDAVAQFYEKQLEEKGFTVARLNSGEGRALSAQRPSGELVTLSVNPNNDKAPKTGIMLTYAKQ